MQNIPSLNTVDHYYNEILQQQANWSSNQLDWLNKIRQVSLSSFLKEGFPTTHIEDWKYTNVDVITQKPFKISTVKAHKISSEQVQAYLLKELTPHYLVFINGNYEPQLSQLNDVPKNVIIQNLADVLKNNPQQIAKQLASITQGKQHGFTQLNNALMSDGAYIYIPKKTIIDKPIQLLFIQTNKDNHCWSQPRNLIVLDELSQATIIETYASLDESSEYFTNAVTEILIAPQAKAEYVKIQQESKQGFHVGTAFAQLQRDSHLFAHSLSLGGKLVRSDFTVSLADIGANCELNGLYLAQHKQHIDHHTSIDHLKPHGTSKEFYRGIIADQARAVFNGKVFVEKDAQQTDAQQENHNLLLSKDAEIDTKPQLEIYANEVKCAHGATVGQLDEEALFYLQSRGVPKAAAKNLLINAFAVTVFDKINNEFMREHLKKLLMMNLLGNN